jgi:membrane-bound serine protease (ClpP class)
VRVHGEIWRARAQQPLQAGERIRVVEREGLVLVVEPA